MGLNPLGVLDISIVTDLLIQKLTDAWHTSPLWASLPPDAYFFPGISGSTPESVRAGGGCQLTITLIHVEPSKYQRNFVFPPAAPPSPQPPSPRAQTIPSLPLGLDLLYFVTAYAENNYHQEQQAMSIALNCFHQNPIVRTNVTLPGSPGETIQEEFTLTLEIESADSISRLWQAITAPFRLSTMYRVAVVFLTPPEAPTGAPPVRTYGLSVSPTSLPTLAGGQIFGTSSTTVFVSPDSMPGAPQTVQTHYSPATVVPGQRFFLYGAGLNQGTDYAGPSPNPGTSFRVYLLFPPDYQTEQDITDSWVVPDSDPSSPIQTQSRFVLNLPDTVGGSPPVNTPEPGVYMLRAGTAGPPNSGSRTNASPFSVAARVDVAGSPADPILQPVAGLYTLSGLGFVPGFTTVRSEEVSNTSVLLETVPLTYVPAGPVADGEFTVNSQSEIVFRCPANQPSGQYGVRVRVNAIESPPALWIRVS